jgi:hypothetical protein
MATLYHLTNPHNHASIMRNGIPAKAGAILVFTDMLVADAVARSQMGMKRYTVYSIDPKGITGALIKNNVAEFPQSYQCILHQRSISPQFLTVVGTYDVDH